MRCRVHASIEASALRGDVASLYASFDAEFAANHDAHESEVVVGDEESGIECGFGAVADRPANGVDNDPEFAAFNDAVASVLAAAPSEWNLSCCPGRKRRSRGASRPPIVPAAWQPQVRTGAGS